MVFAHLYARTRACSASTRGIPFIATCTCHRQRWLCERNRVQHFWQDVLTFIVFAGCFLCLSCVRVRLIEVSAMRVPYHIVTCLLALLCCKRFHVVEHLFSDSVHESMNQGARCSPEPSDVHGERPVLAWSAAPFRMALWEKRSIVIDHCFF